MKQQRKRKGPTGSHPSLTQSIPVKGSQPFFPFEQAITELEAKPRVLVAPRWATAKSIQRETVQRGLGVEASRDKKLATEQVRSGAADPECSVTPACSKPSQQRTEEDTSVPAPGAGCDRLPRPGRERNTYKFARDGQGQAEQQHQCHQDVRRPYPHCVLGCFDGLRPAAEQSRAMA